MQRYATTTNVSAERSKAELEELLRLYGASAVASGWTDEQAFLAFTLCGRTVRLRVPMPATSEFERTESGRRRGATQQRQAFEQAYRARWRALLLVVRAKLEACSIGITTLEREFLADLTLPEGRTVGDVLGADLVRALAAPFTLRLLPAPPTGQA